MRVVGKAIITMILAEPPCLAFGDGTVPDLGIKIVLPKREAICGPLRGKLMPQITADIVSG